MHWYFTESWIKFTNSYHPCHCTTEVHIKGQAKSASWMLPQIVNRLSFNIPYSHASPEQVRNWRHKEKKSQWTSVFWQTLQCFKMLWAYYRKDGRREYTALNWTSSQSRFLDEALNEGGRDERLFSNLSTAKSIYNFKITETVRKMFVLQKSIVCTLFWFLTSQIAPTSIHLLPQRED